jgi:hypothetical protein
MQTESYLFIFTSKVYLLLYSRYLLFFIFLLNIAIKYSLEKQLLAFPEYLTNSISIVPYCVGDTWEITVQNPYN